MAKETWVVVANSSCARIFKLDKNKLHEIRSMEHPESRLRNSELVSDGMGRNFEKSGITRHAYQPKTSPKDVEIDIFAKTICDCLNQGRAEGTCGKLFVIAGPSFLGIIRQKLDGSTRKIVDCEIEKDWTQFEAHDIFDHLQNL